MKNSLWQRYLNACKRGLGIWLDLIALQLFIWGVIFGVWFIYQIGVSIFGY